MQYQELRNKYPTFYYHGFTIEESDTEFITYFDYEIEGLASFKPSYVFPKPEGTSFKGYKAIKECAHALGMIELIKYWKLTCSPQVVIEVGKLNHYQIAWWKDFYYRLLNEFFDVNDIKIGPNTFMKMKSKGNEIQGEEYNVEFSGNLIPVGGGKDSYVSLEILKDQKEENHCFVINDYRAAIEAVEVAGYKDQFIHAHRHKDPKLAELNEEGYLKGYVPMTGAISFAAVMAALLWGKQYICMSVESEGTEFTRRGKTISHQYTKDLSFEKDFNSYVKAYISDQVYYFSLLRPLTDLQITSIFITLKDYLPVFKSCAARQDEGEWCGRCAKCLLVYITLSAFLNDKELVGIFGSNLLEDPGMAKFMHELTGMDDAKPKSVKGARDQVNTAIAMGIKLRQELNKPLPMLYEDYKASYYYESYEHQNRYDNYYNHEHGLPEAFEVRLKRKLEECWNAVD